MKVMLAENQ